MFNKSTLPPDLLEYSGGRDALCRAAIAALHVAEDDCLCLDTVLCFGIQFCQSQLVGAAGDIIHVLRRR